MSQDIQLPCPVIPASEVQLSEDEQRYYSRQLLLPEIGMEGQRALKASRVAVLGAGGLGAPALLYLAGAGVGQILIIDDDAVEVSNLHRQVIHSASRVGTSKADSAAQSLRELNPHIQVQVAKTRLDASNALQLLSGYHLVLDGSDNFPARYALSQACAALGIPHVWAAILGFDAQMSVFWAARGVRYESLYPSAPAEGSVPSCSTAGVMGALAGIVGTSMALEAIKLLTGRGEALLGTLASFSGLSGQWEYVPLALGEPITPTVVFEQGSAEEQGASQASTYASLTLDSVFKSNKQGATKYELSLTFEGEKEEEKESRTTEKTAEYGVNLVTKKPRHKLREISPQELKILMKEGQIDLIDVRERVEYQAFALPGAVNLPLTEIMEAAKNGTLGAVFRQSVSKNSHAFVLYCTGFTRTIPAARELESYTKAPLYILQGGVAGWLTV